MTLPGPSRTIIVEPVERPVPPASPPEPQREPAPAPGPSEPAPGRAPRPGPDRADEPAPVAP